jgi:nucleoside-diphosphate-sugar epimerase
MALQTLKMEQWCLKRSNNSGKTRIVILNPSCVYGPRGKTYTRLPIEFARSGNFCWVDDGRGISNYVYISNLIDAIVLASNTQTAHGQRFLISDGYCSWKKFLSPLLGSYTDSIVSYSQAELLNQSSLAPSTPKDLIRHLVSDLELIDIVNRMPILGSLKRNIFRRSSELHRSMLRLQVDGSDSQDKIRKNSPEQSSLPPAWLANLFGNTTTKFSSAKAQQILGWQSSVSLEQGQSYTVDWLKLIGLC